MIPTGIKGIMTLSLRPWNPPDPTAVPIADFAVKSGVLRQFFGPAGDFPASCELFEYNSSVYALLGTP